MEFIDTHCHIHSVDYLVSIAEVDARCAEAGVTRLICVGTDAADSERAVAFVAERANSWASVGQHPHEAKAGEAPLVKLRALVEAERPRDAATLGSRSTDFHPGGIAPQSVTGDGRRGSTRFLPQQKEGADRPAGPVTIGAQEPAVLGPATKKRTSHMLAKAAREGTLLFGVTQHQAHGDSTGNEPESKIIAIGECGLDYFYGHSSKKDQEIALRYQIELALEYDLPLIFHVRDAFADFWPIVDSYQGVRGVVHSFTDNQDNLEKALSRDLFIGVNGIMTFTKNAWQLEVARQIPLDHLVLETDAPFLTPVPMRGKVNEPARVRLVAQFLSELRQMSLPELADHTTANARHIFSI